jgi:hypothetical protein
MTELQRYRLSLTLAFLGALTVVAYSWTNLQLARMSKLNLPTFERSAPGLQDWPSHQYLPIG